MRIKTILHVIDSLGIGGAESLLVNANILIPGYRHIIVYLKKPNNYECLLQDIPVFCLNFRGWLSLPKAAYKLNKIIRKENVRLVHTHLYYSTIIARLSYWENIKLVTTYHSLLYNPENTAQYSKKLLLLDVLTYRDYHHLIFVSKEVQANISKKVGVKRNYEILYNYVEDKFFSNETSITSLKHNDLLRAVILGNLRLEKNYSVVIKAMSLISSNDVILDIYGEGSQRKLLEEQINLYKLKGRVNLKGHIKETNKILPNYHLYIAPSKFEGFGIALIEAMASGLPCLVSNIATHKEIAKDTVIYFDPNCPEELAEKINQILDGNLCLDDLKFHSRERAEAFKKDAYLNNLTKIYGRILSNE